MITDHISIISPQDNIMIIKEEESYNLQTECQTMEARIMSQVSALIDKIQNDLHETQDDLHETQDELRRTREELRKTQEGLTEQQHKNAALEATVTNLSASQCRSDLIDEYQKWVVVLQDINDLYQLESAVQYLTDLRQVRTRQCHFILTTDTPQVKAYKVEQARKQLASMSNECKKMFSDNFGANFLATLSANIPVPPGGRVSQREKYSAERWWTD